MTQVYTSLGTALPIGIDSLYIAGDTLNGGGQLVRLAMGLSALTRKPLVLEKIRANRPGNGGLKSQHVAALHFLRDAARATVIGGLKGSDRIEMLYPTQYPTSSNSLPQSYREEEIVADGGRIPRRHASDSTQVLPTRISQQKLGSIGLVFQAILPFLLFYSPDTVLLDDSDNQQRKLPIVLDITGGTNVPLSPSIDHITHVLLPTLARIGVPPISVRVNKRGWSSDGELTPGSAHFSIQSLPQGEALRNFTVGKRGNLANIHAVLVAPKLLESDILSVLESKLRSKLLNIDASICPISSTGSFSFTAEFEDSGKPGCFYILLVATCTQGYKLSSDYLYDEKNRDGKSEARMDASSWSLDRCLDVLIEQFQEELATGSGVDRYMQDQLAVYQGLAQGRSSVYCGKTTMHTKTARWAVGKILDVEFSSQGVCEGLGFRIARL